MDAVLKFNALTKSFGHSPADVARQGVSVVWQDLALCDNLDAVANIYLGREIGRTGSMEA